jgi:hypothetical protein
MRADVDKLYSGNYRFTVEIDTGAETGSNQLTVWFAEKVHVETVPLSHFKLPQLFRALQEPYRTSLQAQLEAEQRACRKPFKEEIASLKSAPVQEGASHERRGGTKRRSNDLSKQMNIALQRLDADFTHRALLTLDREYFDPAILQQENRLFGDDHFLRDFYFEETNPKYIRNFCHKFALSEPYRQQVLARETPWAKRNALFVRNVFAVWEELPGTTSSREEDEQKLSDFFHWIDAHYEAILALPEYQQLQQLDTAFKPNAKVLDPFIQPAVELLNQIPGVTTQYSCQGVSGKVHFQGRTLLAVSEHEEFAYVSFAELEQPAKDIIEALLPAFPAVTDVPLPFNFALRSLLRSTGDNLRFRVELVALAQRALDTVNGQGSL